MRILLLTLALLAAARADDSGAVYRIGAGDALQVTVYGEPGLSGVFPVDAAGRLEFPLLGAVEVEGLSASEAVDLLRARLDAGYVVHPSVTVSLSAYRSQPVQVLGAVAKPGLYFLRGPTTVMQILSEAGGVRADGVNEVRVTRGGQSGAVTIVPYEQLLTQGAAGVSLAGGDIVFVPQSLISVMGRVGKPGEIAFRDGLTVSQCIAAVGGALPEANLGRLYILRGEQRIRVNLKKILSGRAVDVVLEPGDRIFVPESIV